MDVENAEGTDVEKRENRIGNVNGRKSSDWLPRFEQVRNRCTTGNRPIEFSSAMKVWEAWMGGF